MDAGVEEHLAHYVGQCGLRRGELQLALESQAFAEPQKIDVRVGDASVDSFSLAAGHRELRRIAVSAAQLGTGETVDVTISVDKTFVPASVAQLKSLDPRELGVRVFHAFVEPKQ